MALITPAGPSWAYCSDNLPATPSLLTPGTTVTSDGSANTDGAEVTLLTALAHDCEYLVIGAEGNFSAASNRSALLDILVDPAGGTSWSELIADLLVGYALVKSGTSMMTPSYQYHFPIWLPAGASVGARVQCATASIATQVTILAFGGNSNPGSWACGQRVETVGTMSTSTSQGQAHTAGNSGEFSSWTDLGSALTYSGIAAQFATQGDGTNAITNVAYHFEYGAASTRIGPRRYHCTGTGEVVAPGLSVPVFYRFPAGLQMQVRGTCSGTAESVDVAAYVVS